MDSIINSALEEICARGVSGIPISDLWPSLKGVLSSSGLNLCDAVKNIIWFRLLAVPALRFDANGCVLSAQDPKIQSWGESQRLGLRIVADELLRDSFVGLDDLNAANANIPEGQRRTLERVAAARANGITQCELSKEFGIKGNHFFYQVRNLECQQLIIRQSTILREKDIGKVETGPKNIHISHTNLIHLYRYAKNANMNSQQKIEITKSALPDMIESIGDEDKSSIIGDVQAGECIKDDVLIKDYLPAMKAICDKLDEANDKVLVVSDIKVALGYRMIRGHRAWRNIVSRLEDAGLVEKFQAEVNTKDLQCLRLLKKFDPKDFQLKPCVSGYDGFDSNNLVKHGKRGQITDQFLELPIEYRIHDIVDAEGPKGITITEICKRLGLNPKRMYTRIAGMCSRFGMCMESEKPNRTLLYRVWTRKNYQLYLSNVSYGNHEEVPGRTKLVTKSNDTILSEQLTPDAPQLNSSFQDIGLNSQKSHSAVNVNFSCTSDGVAAHAQLSTFREETQNLMHECSNASNDAQPDTSERVTECNIAVSETPTSVSPTMSKQTQRSRSVSSTVLGARREQWILNRLKDDKFILCGELYRWIKNLEMDRPSMLDRKTLDRTLNKLQQDGLCKIIQVTIPAMTNFSRIRDQGVVMHPSIDNISSDLLNQIYKSYRDFEFQSRSRESTRPTNQPVTVLTGVERSSNPVDDKPELLESMRANGFVPAKMVRARLLHNFLWGYIGGLFNSQDCLQSPEHDSDLKHHYGTCHFVMGTAIEAMPFELFLQVVGSAKEIDDVLQKCKLGLRLMDLSVEECKRLLDTHATARISRIINVLLRLKLIKLVWKGPAGEDLLRRSTPTHAMELEPYIEEPMPRVLPHLKINSSDLRPRIRHDFVLSDLGDVNAYWEALEYSYAAADPVSASLSFPGSVVHEVFSARSWTSVRVMTAEQRKELLKRMEIDNLEKKIPFKECVQIARELNLSVEQVLRVSYDKQHRRVHGDSLTSELKRRRMHMNGNKSETVSQKRRVSTDLSIEHVQDDAQLTEARPAMSISPGAVGNIFGVDSSVLNETEIHDNPEDCTGNSHGTSGPEPEPHEEGSETYSLIRRHAYSRSKPVRRRRFIWTDKTDRQLLVQYARYRVTMGERSHRVIWTSLSDLPTHPLVCGRRMAMLNSDKSTRRAVMRLCNLLGERYRRYLNNAWRALGTEDPSQGHSTMSQEGLIVDTFGQNILAAHENSSDENIQQNCWDNFEDSDLKVALDEVLRCKKMAKVECTKAVGSRHGKDWPDTPIGGTNLDVDEHVNSMEHDLFSSTVGEKDKGLGETENKGANILLPVGQSKPSSNLSNKKFTKLLSNRGIGVRKQVCESITVANAVELLKLVFLSTSAAPDAQASLAAMLQLYSKCDILAAFDFLKEKEFVVIGNGGGSPLLSKRFWHNASYSPFPVDSGKRASSFSSWLHKHDKFLEDGLDLSLDLQCGEIFHLFALVSSGQLFILPCLPKEGTGEADETRRSEPLMLMDDEMKSLKRKSDKAEIPCSNEEAKRQKSQGKVDTDFCSRREKGFPGMKVLVSRSSTPRVDVLQRSVDGENQKLLSATDEMNRPKDLDKETIPFVSAASNLNLSSNFGCEVQLEESLDEPQWHSMTKYAAILSASVCSNDPITFCPEVFKSVHSAIDQMGEQGLSIQEISRMMGTQEVELAEVMVNTLEVHQLAMKVNAYDSVRVVSSSYRSKYFICKFCNHGQDNFMASYLRSQGMNCKKKLHASQEKHDTYYESQNYTSLIIRDGHRVSLLNNPKLDVFQVEKDPNKEHDASEVDKQGNLLHVRRNESENRSSATPGVLDVHHSILPWINSDGSTNTIIYKGLTRRVLGTVMQNPGILEEDIIPKMDVLNPQTCRRLLEAMTREERISVRSVCLTTEVGPPSILQSLFPSDVGKPKSVYQKHYFANPMSTSEL